MSFSRLACAVHGLSIPIVKDGGVLGLQNGMEIDTASVSRKLSMLEPREGCYATKNLKLVQAVQSEICISQHGGTQREGTRPRHDFRTESYDCAEYMRLLLLFASCSNATVSKTLYSLVGCKG